MAVEAQSAFAPEPASIGAARGFVRDVLRRWGSDDLVDVATLLTSELTTNALLHARTNFRVVLQQTTAGVRVAVHDRSRALPVIKHFATDASTGRGLRLLERLAAEWGVAAGSGPNEAKSVWFRLRTTVETVPTSEEPDLEAWLALDDAVAKEAARRKNDDELLDVVLLQLPLDVYRRALQHSDELARELRLIAGTPMDSQSVPSRLRRLIHELAVRYAPLNPAAERQLQRASALGLPHADVTYRVPPQTADDVRALDALLEEADDHCRSGQGLLTLTTPPEALTFRRWVFGEITRQIDGAEPQPWPGPERWPLADLP